MFCSSGQRDQSACGLFCQTAAATIKRNERKRELKDGGREKEDMIEGCDDRGCYLRLVDETKLAQVTFTQVLKEHQRNQLLKKCDRMGGK